MKRESERYSTIVIESTAMKINDFHVSRVLPKWTVDSGHEFRKTRVKKNIVSVSTPDPPLIKAYQMIDELT